MNKESNINMDNSLELRGDRKLSEMIEHSRRNNSEHKSNPILEERINEGEGQVVGRLEILNLIP